MLCWLAFGDHRALKSDTPTLTILIPAQGKPTIRVDGLHAFVLTYAPACKLRCLHANTLTCLCVYMMTYVHLYMLASLYVFIC